MKPEVYASVGVDWTILVPETVDEYNTLARQAGNPCLDAAIDHIVFHDTLGDIRHEFAEALSKELKIERLKKETGEKDDKGAAITKPENDGAFINRMLAQTGKKATDFTDIIKAVSEKVTFDPSVSARTGKSKETPKFATNAAKELLAMHGREVNGKLVDVNVITSTLEGLNPDCAKAERPEGSATPTSESLAKLIAANEARKKAAVKLSTVYADPSAVA